MTTQTKTTNRFRNIRKDANMKPTHGRARVGAARKKIPETVVFSLAIYLRLGKRLHKQ